ncbi:MAG: uracil-DNA glycosylase family protein [archaeon]
MEYVAAKRSNPFDLDPPCEHFVPGYGTSNADFHVIGDHPGRHGGIETGIPFTGSESGTRLLDVLQQVGLLDWDGDVPIPGSLYLSYLFLCVDSEEPTETAYAEMERFFDAELRAITAHVLLPVGVRAIRYVLENYTTEPATDVDVDRLHATEISGGGWLVVPVAEPSTWTDVQRNAIVETVERILARDYRRESDLGRFFPGGSAYMVR